MLYPKTSTPNKKGTLSPMARKLPKVNDRSSSKDKSALHRSAIYNQASNIQELIDLLGDDPDGTVSEYQLFETRRLLGEAISILT